MSLQTSYCSASSQAFEEQGWGLGSVGYRSWNSLLKKTPSICHPAACHPEVSLQPASPGCLWKMETVDKRRMTTLRFCFDKTMAYITSHPNPSAEPIPPVECLLTKLSRRHSTKSSAKLGCSTWELFVTELVCLESWPLLTCLQKPLILHTSGAGRPHQFFCIPDDGNVVPTVTAQTSFLLQEKLLTCLSLCTEPAINMALLYGYCD